MTSGVGRSEFKNGYPHSGLTNRQVACYHPPMIAPKMERHTLYQAKRQAFTEADISTADELKLVRRAARHDVYAFAKLYDYFVDRIYKYIYFKIGNAPDAEDLTAQVFLKAWEAIPSYHITGRPFSAWLYRIAHNAVVDYFRMRRETVSLDDVSREDRSANLDELTDQQLTAEALQRAIRRLTEAQRQVILLRFIEGYSTEEVAVVMGKGEGAIRTLQHRALASLERIFRRGTEQI